MNSIGITQIITSFMTDTNLNLNVAYRKHMYRTSGRIGDYFQVQFKV